MTRCILIEVAARVSGVETTRYLSSMPFVSKSTDTPASKIYEPILRGNSIQIVERFTVPISESPGSIAFGDIEIDNRDGSLNSWMDDIWVNRTCVAYIGDVRWARADFQIIFNGVVEDIGSRAKGFLNLKFRDKFHRLNTPLTDVKLGGSTNNKDKIKPLLFGECHNITPLLTDPATLEFQCHDGIIEDVIEVRDEGVPVAFTENLTTGKVTLAATPAGKVTMSVQGAKPSGTWLTKPAELIQHIVTTYGEPNKRFTTADIDTANFSDFNATYTQPLGIYADERENTLQLCSKIANSVGAVMLLSREGKLKLHRFRLAANPTIDIITESDVIKNSFHITGLTEVKAAQRLGYCKNWTIQTKLETGIPVEHKDLYEKEWLVATAENSTTKSDYKLDEEPKQIDTYLIRSTDAQAEANRLLNLYRVGRTLFRFEGVPRLLDLELGDWVEIQHSALSYKFGTVRAVIIGLSPNWHTGRVLVEGII